MMKKTLFAILFMTITVCAFAQGESDKVWLQVEALTKAIFETKDSMALKELVSDNVTYGHSSGVIEDKATMIFKAVTNKSMYRDRSFEKISIDIQGKMAIVRHNFRAVTVDEAGKESPLELGIMQVWKKEKGKWRIWARQAFRLPAQTAY